MKTNVGNFDRIVRLVIAALFAILYFGGFVTGTIGLVLIILGGVFAVTAAIGFCPLYSIFGLTTCPVKSR